MTTLAEIREALAQIVDYQPEPSELAIPDHSECPECLGRQGQHWPPSEMCEALYSAVSRRNDENRRREAFQHYQMRLIARDALASLPTDGVIVTPDALERLMVRVCTEHGWTMWAPRDPFISAILAAVAAEGSPA